MFYRLIAVAVLRLMPVFCLYLHRHIYTGFGISSLIALRNIPHVHILLTVKINKIYYRLHRLREVE